MKKRITLPIFIALLIVGAVAVLGLTLFYPRTQSPQRIMIATATEGGTYYKLGCEFELILKDVLDERIGDVNAVQTSGSIDNIQRLMDPNSPVNVAFTMKSDLLEANRKNPETRQKLCILARLYMDVMQIVVRKDKEIADINDLKNRRVFIGPKDSGTRKNAKQILETVGLSGESYTTDDALDDLSFAEAAKRLKEDKLDAAFFMAGTPTAAVEKALKSGECELLSLDPKTLASLTESSRELGLEEEKIPANIYPNQPEVQTVASDVFLVCRRDLDEEMAFFIVKTLFDEIGRLLIVHTKADDIRLVEAFDNPEDPPLDLHPGAKKFLEETLLIATGALNGKYYQLGKAIQRRLEDCGIPAIAIHTDGSLQNARLLNERRAIAFMQYDAALASQSSSPKSIYNLESFDQVSIDPVKGLRRIAVFHKEKAHVLVRRDKLKDIEKKLKWDPNAITTLSKLAEAMLKLPQEQLRVCLGPPGSATQIMAQMIFEHHGLTAYTIQSLHPVSKMVDLLLSEEQELDAGFFVSHVPSGALKRVLDDKRIRLLSLGPRAMARMTTCTFETSTIEPNTYGCQLKNEPAIQTLATRAVLVTTTGLPEGDVKTIAKVVFEGMAYLPVKDLTKKGMAEDLPSLALHPGAVQYYKEAGLLPSESLLQRLQKTWYILGCLTMLITVMFIPAYTGLIILRRSRTGNEIGRRILAIPIEASVRDSVQRLLKIRDEIQKRVRRRWWKWGELDKHRWRYLRDLIHDRIGEAKENLTRAFVAEIRDVARNHKLDRATRKQRYRSIEDRILEYFEKAELDPSQQKMLRELLRETSQQDAKTKESKDEKNK